MFFYGGFPSFYSFTLQRRSEKLTKAELDVENVAAVVGVVRLLALDRVPAFAEITHHFSVFIQSGI